MPPEEFEIPLRSLNLQTSIRGGGETCNTLILSFNGNNH